MKAISISGSLRENVGKKDATALRNSGNVPCVIYGGKEQVHFYTNEKAFKKVIFTPEVQLIKIELGKKTIMASLQDIQYHPTSDRVIHVDFLEIIDGKPITIGIPVKLVGSAPGVLKGGKLVIKMRKLKVRALAEDLPDNIDIDISGLEIGDVFKVQELTSDKLTYLNLSTDVVVTVKSTRAVEEPVVPGAPPVAK